MMQKASQQNSQKSSDDQILNQARDGVRSVVHRIGIGTGVAGVTTLALLAGGSMIPFLQNGLTAQTLIVWLAGLGGNALAGWLGSWTERAVNRFVTGEPDKEQLLADLASDLSHQMANNNELQDDVAKYLEVINAVPDSIRALSGHIEQQQALIIALREDVRDTERIQRRLHRLIVNSLAEQTETLVNNYKHLSEEPTRELKALRDELERLRRELLHKPIHPDHIWLWESFGKNAFSWLVNHLGKQAAEQKEVEWEKVDWARASQMYRQEMAYRYGTMQILGMTDPVPLSDIFTDVYLLDKPMALQRHALEELQERSPSEHESLLRNQRRDGVVLVNAEKRLYILGQPGAGKTTFLKYLVLQAVAEKLQAIPIFISLKVWSDAGIDLLPFMVRQFAICSFPDAQPFIEQILEDGSAIVLFDGLDEVNLEDKARERIIDAVRDFAQQYRRSQVVITCRTAATYYIFEGFKYCELAEFTQEQMDAFVARWFRNDDVKRQAFWKALNQPEQEHLRDLGRRPLLLTMLCLTFDETMAFPHRRAELYEEAIEALLKKWDASRSIHRDTIYYKLSLGYKRQLLMDIANETFERGEQFMQKRDLVGRIVKFLRRLPTADNTEDIDGEAVLKEIESQHGLIIERARNIYSFSHLTFQEYFTARYINHHPELAVLRTTIAHAADARWREVLLLTASMFDDRNAANMFRIWYEELQQKIQTDSRLSAFIKWVAHQDRNAGSPGHIGVRITAMMMALIDCGLCLAGGLARDLASACDLAISSYDARDLTIAHTSALTIAHTIAVARPGNLAPDLSRARDRLRSLVYGSTVASASSSPPARAFADARTLAQNRASLLASALSLGPTLDHIRSQTLVRLSNETSIDSSRNPNLELFRLTEWYGILQCAEYLALGGSTSASESRKLGYEDFEIRLSQLSSHPSVRSGQNQLDVLLIKELYAMMPKPSTMDAAAWAAFAATTRERLIQRLDIGHRWEFTVKQLDVLANYLASTSRLLECLEDAQVEDRQSIVSHLLRLPDPARTGRSRGRSVTKRKKTDE